MKHLRALVSMQLRDKVDFSFVKERKSLIIKTVLSVVKFLVVAVVAYALILVCNKLLNLFYASEIPEVMVFVITLFFILSVISCTSGLVKTMFLAEDNKVLVTFPVNGNIVFASKLIVFYLYELKRNFFFLVPIILAFGVYFSESMSAAFFIVIWLPLILYTALPVLMGALLSIPAMYIVKLIKKIPLIGLALFVIVASAIIYGLATLIELIPADIDLINTWLYVKPVIQQFLINFEKSSYAISQFVHIIIGELQPNLTYAYEWLSLLKFVILTIAIAIMFFAVFFLTRYFFYSTMRKNYEFTKRAGFHGKNRKRRPFLSFIRKELLLSARSNGILMNFIAVYVFVPLMIFLLNKIYSAMNTRVTGEVMAYAFNILIIILPILASNSLIATLYSREGMAGYIKKTKPINVLMPLISKIAVYLVGATVSICVAVTVFSGFNTIGSGNAALLAIGLCLLNAGHMFFSASLDIMNPQNKQYATAGETFSNSNENTATITAFIISAVLALFSYMLFSEASLYNSLTTAFTKIFFIGLAVFVSAFYMFCKKIKVYYAEK